MHLQEYIPTIIVLTPPRPEHLLEVPGVILDGHQKIQAAKEIGGPVRVMMIEMKHPVRKLLVLPRARGYDYRVFEEGEFEMYDDENLKPKLRKGPTPIQKPRKTKKHTKKMSNRFCSVTTMRKKNYSTLESRLTFKQKGWRKKKKRIHPSNWRITTCYYHILQHIIL